MDLRRIATRISLTQPLQERRDYGAAAEEEEEPRLAILTAPPKHFIDYSIQIDRDSFPHFPHFKFKGKFVDDNGIAHDTEFEVGVDLFKLDARIDHISGFDIAGEQVKKIKGDWELELYDLIYDTQEYKDVLEGNESPNPKQLQILNSDDPSVGDLLDAK